MDRHIVSFFKAELRTCALCENPADAVRTGRVGISICQSCAVKELPALLADAVYPDEVDWEAFTQEHRRIMAYHARVEQRTRAALRTHWQQAQEEMGPAASAALFAEVAPAGTTLDALDYNQAQELDLRLTNALGEKIIEETPSLAALWPELAAASRERRRPLEGSA